MPIAPRRETQDHWDTGLDPAIPVLHALLAPNDLHRALHPVDPWVSNVRNDSTESILPLARS